jgi:hypothetical protein
VRSPGAGQRGARYAAQVSAAGGEHGVRSAGERGAVQVSTTRCARCAVYMRARRGAGERGAVCGVRNMRAVCDVRVRRAVSAVCAAQIITSARSRPRSLLFLQYFLPRSRSLFEAVHYISCPYTHLHSITRLPISYCTSSIL